MEILRISAHESISLRPGVRARAIREIIEGIFLLREHTRDDARQIFLAHTAIASLQCSHQSPKCAPTPGLAMLALQLIFLVNLPAAFDKLNAP
jgi:hypothetical protein